MRVEQSHTRGNARSAGARRISFSLAAILTIGGILAAGALSLPDRRSPSPPLTFRVVGTTPTSISLAWRSASGNGAEYRLHIGGKLLVTTRARTYEVTGLRCGRAYRFTLDAADSAGNRSARRFLVSATKACPDRSQPGAPTGILQTAASETTISIRWTSSSDNVAVAGYGIYVGALRVATAKQPTFTLTGLACGSSYALSLDSYDRAGNRSPRSSVTVTTAACRDTQAPSSPTALRASTTQTSATLSWTAARDNVAVAGYAVLQDGVRVGETTSVSYLLAGLACGRTYAVSVDAYDAAGNRSQAAAVTVTTRACSSAPPPPPPPRPPAADTQAPTVPGPIDVTSTSDTTITITWAASSDNRGVAGYGAYLDGTRVTGTPRTTLTFSGLSCGTSYIVAVDAYDAARNQSEQASVVAGTSPCEAEADTEPPTAPTELIVEAAGQTKLTLAWKAASDNRGVAGYGLYVAGNLVASTAETDFTLSELTCGTEYTVAVDAYDAAGNRSDATSLDVETASCQSETDTQPPTTPEDLAVTAASETGLELAWQPASDNVAVAGYGVYVNETLVAKSPGTSHTLGRLTCGTDYGVAVDAYDAAGNRSERTAIEARTSDCPSVGDSEPPSAPEGLVVEAASETALELAWQPAIDNVAVAGYGVYQNGAPVGTTRETRFTLSGLTCGRGYSVAVDAFDAAGNRSGSVTVVASTSPCPDTTPPAAPTNFRQADRTRTSVSLVWNPGSEARLVGYGVYRNGVRVATTAGTSFGFSGLACGTTYTFGVDAYDESGNRSELTTLLASTLDCPPPPGPTPPPGPLPNGLLTAANFVYEGSALLPESVCDSTPTFTTGALAMRGSGQALVTGHVYTAGGGLVDLYSADFRSEAPFDRVMKIQDVCPLKNDDISSYVTGCDFWPEANAPPGSLANRLFCTVSVPYNTIDFSYKTISPITFGTDDSVTVGDTIRVDSNSFNVRNIVFRIPESEQASFGGSTHFVGAGGPGLSGSGPAASYGPFLKAVNFADPDNGRVVSQWPTGHEDYHGWFPRDPDYHICEGQSGSWIGADPEMVTVPDPLNPGQTRDERRGWIHTVDSLGGEGHSLGAAVIGKSLVMFIRFATSACYTYPEAAIWDYDSLGPQYTEMLVWDLDRLARNYESEDPDLAILPDYRARWQSPSAFSGFVSAIAQDPDDPEHVFILEYDALPGPYAPEPAIHRYRLVEGPE